MALRVARPSTPFKILARLNAAMRTTGDSVTEIVQIGRIRGAF
jgi:hypothetical protein